MATLIRLFSGTLAGGGVNHMFLCWQDPHLGWVTLGANSNGVTMIPWKEFTAKRKVPAIFKPKDPKVSLWDGLKALEYEINVRYDYPAIVGIGLIGIAEFFMQKKLGAPNWVDLDKKEQFCSEFASSVIKKSGFLFLPGVPSNEIKPQDAYHELVRRLDFVQGEVPA